MPELDDQQLLREFARENSPDAFAALVTRYVNLVYSAALRSTGNPDHAAEIVQAVFVILARKAGSLRPGTVLSGWLYQTARLTAANFVKGEIRRQRREQEAYMQSTLGQPQTMAWDQIAPLLDEAMGDLNETDRNAVVLRFFENKSAREVAAVLKVKEATAHKRVSRALEKLRKFFAKRGVTSTTAIIAGAVLANSVQAAPAGLAKTAATLAVTKGASASVSTLVLMKTTLRTMAWAKAKTALIAGITLILAISAATLVLQHQHGRRVQASDGFYPRETWAAVGYASPEAAFESAIWARSQGDVAALLASVTPDGGFFRDLQGTFQGETVAKGKRELENVTGFRITHKETMSADEVILTVQLEGRNPNGEPLGSANAEGFRVQHIPSGWKVAGAVNRRNDPVPKP